MLLSTSAKKTYIYILKNKKKHFTHSHKHTQQGIPLQWLKLA